MINRRTFLARSIATALAAPALYTGARAQSVSPHLAGAEAEGELLIYGSPIAVPPLSKAFMAAYPKIKVLSVTGGGWEMYSRFETEKGAGQNLADVLFTSEDTMQTAAAANELAPYKPATASDLLPMALSPDQMLTLTSGHLLLPFYNASAIGNAALPKDWTDFAKPDPSWKNIMVMSDARGSSAVFSMISGIYQDYGKDVGASIFEGMRAAGIEVVQNTGLAMTKVQNGECPLAPVGVTSYLGQLRKFGAPIEVVIPSSGPMAQFDAIGIPTTARHPNAARLFVDYVLSAEGQKILSDASFYVVHKGSTPPPTLPPLEGLTLRPVDLRKALAEKETIISWWKQSLAVD